MLLNQIMESPRLKIKRANRHIDEIVRDLASPPKDLYTLGVGEARSSAVLAKPDRFQLAYQPHGSIAKHFGSIMGDVVNNLRESLDYWINTAVEAHTGKRPKWHFPFSFEGKELEKSEFYPKLNKAFPAAADFILKDVKPSRDTNFELWAVTSFCNFNKHNDFVPMASATEVRNVNAQLGAVKIDSRGGGYIQWPADSPMILIDSNTPFAMEENLGIALQIAFPKGALFEGQPIIPTLTNLSEVVSQTLGALERFITPYAK